MLRIETLLVFTLFVVLSNGQKYFASSDYCLSSDSNPYLLFSTKTSYDVARGAAESASACKPIQFWSLNRHGSRHASEKDLIDMKLAIDLQKQILNNYESGNAPKVGGLCDVDLKAIKDWKWNSTIENMSNVLTAEGWRELKEIAQRYQKRYPELLTSYSADQFYFRHTNEQRTWASCRAHIEGLFGSYDKITIDEPKDQDEVIRPYSMCPAWSVAVDDNDDFRKEQKRIFRKEADYLKLLSDVTKRLGFSKTLKKDDIDIMYDNCRYDKSLYPTKISPWCSVFTKSDLFLMEYYEDLGQFYKCGFSHDFNPKLGCLPLKNMMETFKKTVADKVAKPRVVSLFSHDTMINLMFTTLEFGKDDKPLMGTNYQDLMVNRRFRSSLNSPFAGNFAAILHQCTSGQFEVQFFINERPMDLKGCPKGLCSWDYLKEFLSVTEKCNLDFCNI